MSEDWEKLLDDAGWNILDELQRNARVSFAELGRRVGLSTPAVLERVHKMEACGIILGYHAKLDRAKTGMPITAFIRLSVLGDLLQRVIAIAEKLDEVLECHRVTGTDSFVIKVGVSSVEHIAGTVRQICAVCGDDDLHYSFLSGDASYYRADTDQKKEKKRARTS
jgi:Lrp/AsnC family leucine-responsive transcriptional regulator